MIDQTKHSYDVFYSGSVVCGGGKTQAALKTVTARLIEAVHNGSEFSPVVIASKTIDLAKQTLKDMLALAPDNEALPITLVSQEASAKRGFGASRELYCLLSEGFSGGVYQGVILCSHAALGLVNPVVLAGATVIIDEVPSGGELAGLIDTTYADDDDVAVWDSFFDYDQLGTSNVWRVSVKDSKIFDLTMKLANHRVGNSNNMSSNEYAVFNYLLEKPDVEVLYRRKQRKLDLDAVDYNAGVRKEVTQHIFEAVESDRLRKIVEHAGKLTFLAASFESSLVHFLLTRVLNATLKVDFELLGTLPSEHTAPVTIHPILKKGNWSKYCRTGKANKFLEGVKARGTVQDYAVKLAEKLLERDFLLFTNNDFNGELILIKNMVGKNVQRLPIAVHGMNNYSSFHKSAYIASSNPSNEEVALLRRFADGYDLNGDELVTAVKAERAHEANYQCAGRLSFRNRDSVEPCIIIVPDMAHAHYIAARFADGTCVIDTTHSKVLLTQDNLTKEEKELNEATRINKRLCKAVEYYEAVRDKPNGVLVRDVQAHFGIKKLTVSRWKKEFAVELKALGLIK